MGVSKVTINGEPVMDVTEMTVDEDSLLVGETALRNDGETVTGAVVTAPASDTAPLVDGTASAGVSDTYSRGDHVHPTDTSRAAAVHMHTTSEITDFPTNVSEFDNDAGYLTMEVDPVFSASPSAGITSADIAGWDAKAEVSDIPTAVSELDNDAGYLSVEADPVFSASPAHGISTTDISNWSAKAEVSDIPTKVSELANDEGYLTTETDPVYSASVAAGITAQNVSSWNAKAEVSDIPTDVSELNNDAGYLTTETDPTVPAWAKAATKPSYTPAEVGAATSDHVHGNITNGGDITVNVAIESGDRLVINDESGSKIANSSITFGTSTDTFLRNDGTWGNPAGGVTSVNSKTGDVVLDAEDVGALPDDTFIPESTSDLTNDSDFVSDANYVHTDSNFTAAEKTKLAGIAEGATVDDHKWNDVALDKGFSPSSQDFYVPFLSATTGTRAALALATNSPAANRIAKYDANRYLNSTTPSADDSSTKVATTAFVGNAISSLGYVLNYKGTKATVAELPATGNETGDVWIVTADSSEHVWNGSAWEKFGPTIDLSGYVPTTRTVNGKALSTDISLGAEDVGALADDTAIPRKTSDLTNDSGFITSADVPQEVFIATYGTTTFAEVQAAYNAGKVIIARYGEINAILTNVSSVLFQFKYLITTGTGRFAWLNLSSSGWNNGYSSYFVQTSRTVNGKDLSSDITLDASDVGALPDSTDVTKWNGVALNTGVTYMSNPVIPALYSSSQKTAFLIPVSNTPVAIKQAISQYDSDGYLNSTTPTAGDSSTKVATTAFVNTAISNIDALPDQTGQSGKFLTTNGTAASWADNPPEIFWVNATETFSPTQQVTVTVEKTISEIVAAKESGKLPVLLVNGQDIRTLSSCETEEDYAYVEFTKISTYYSWTISGEHTDGEDFWYGSYDILASIDSPTFEGTPTAPTPTFTSVATQIATKGYVDNHTPDLSGYMQKGVDYVTAGKTASSILGSKATAEGESNIATGARAHAEGNSTTASGNNSHAEGYFTQATQSSAHAEGTSSIASGSSSHAEGTSTNATGLSSHAEGNSTTASGDASHAEGQEVTASGRFSHAEGYKTEANHKSQHVFGEYNILDTNVATATARGDYVEIVGNGTSTSARSNARTLDWSGNEVLAGKLTVGAGPTNNMDVATKQYVDTAVRSVDAFPPQSGQSGKFLTTNGTTASWATVTIPTYTLSISGNRITLTPSSGTASYIDLPVYNGTVV